jgi:pimeloyl-ACP methyl ester carboxylesterase
VYYGLLGVVAILPVLVSSTASRSKALISLVWLPAVLAAIAYINFRHDLEIARQRVTDGSRIAATRCGEIEYSESGAGSPLLMVHGAGGGFDQGTDFAADLPGFRVIAMSRFGYLRTPLPRDASPAAQADAHACLLDTLGIEAAGIIGASAGAPSSMQFCIRHPDRCAGMVLLVPLAYPRPNAPSPPSPIARFMFENAVKSDFLFWIAMRAVPSVVTRTLLATPPELLEKVPAEERERVQKMMERILPLSRRQEGLLNDAAVASSLPRFDLEKIRAPALVISAVDDLYGTLEGARYTADHITGARLVVYETGGHVWVGHHAQTAATISRFLSAAIQSARKD